METNIVELAVEFATIAHRGQVRKYTGEPYIVHPFSVAGLVAGVGGDDAMICAALLHDTVEDCGIKIETIRGLYGQSVAQMVDDLTDVSKLSDGNRAKRKAIDFEHTSLGGKDSHTIKLADLIDNTKTIVMYDNEFAAVYMEEKRRLLEVLKDGDSQLFNIASDMVNSYFNAP